MLHILQVQYQFFSRPDNNLGLTRKSYWEARDMTKRKVENPKKKKLYVSLDSYQGWKDFYRLAMQKDQAGKDVQQVRAIKDRDGNVLTSDSSLLRRWKEHFQDLMSEEN